MITACSCNWICNIADFADNGQGLLQGCAAGRLPRAPSWKGHRIYFFILRNMDSPQI
jgi:hypothetical protein